MRHGTLRAVIVVLFLAVGASAAPAPARYFWYWPDGQGYYFQIAPIGVYEPLVSGLTGDFRVKTYRCDASPGPVGTTRYVADWYSSVPVHRPGPATCPGPTRKGSAAGSVDGIKWYFAQFRGMDGLKPAPPWNTAP